MIYYFQDCQYEIEKGEEIREVLARYGLGVSHVKYDNFIEKWGGKEKDLYLVGEEGLEEYRVNIGRLHNLDSLKDNYGCVTEEEFLKEDWHKPEDTLKEFRNELEKVSNGFSEEISYNLTFSVFLEDRVWDDDFKNDSKLRIEFENYCLGLGYNYYQTVSRIFKRFDFSDHMDAYTNDIDEFKAFLNEQYIEINNNNIEIIKNNSYRLYKDAKFYDSLQREVRDYDSLITELDEL